MFDTGHVKPQIAKAQERHPLFQDLIPQQQACGGKQILETQLILLDCAFQRTGTLLIGLKMKEKQKSC